MKKRSPRPVWRLSGEARYAGDGKGREVPADGRPGSAQQTHDSLAMVLQNRHQPALSGIADDDIYGMRPLPLLT